jgi:hypothetical protein
MASHLAGSPGDVVFTHQHVELLFEGVDLFFHGSSRRNSIPG